MAFLHFAIQRQTSPWWPLGPSASSNGTYSMNVTDTAITMESITMRPNLLKNVICAKNRMMADISVVNAAEMIGKPS